MDNLLDILLPYQRRWVEDRSRFKIGMWSRQTGKSFATACEAVLDCALEPGDLWVVLSAGERQALEWMAKAKAWAEAAELAVDSYEETRGSASSVMTRAEIRFRNRSRIMAIPANPDTARGYSANLVLDEFAIHERPYDIWAAIYPSITNALAGEKKLRIVSTPKGRGNKFADLWEHSELYSKHRVTIEDAVAQGLKADVAALREGVADPDIWAQEYMCEFIDSTSVLLPYDLIGRCEADPAACADPGGAPLYIGMDVGRSRDLSVIATAADAGGTLVVTECVALVGTPFHEQLDILVSKCRDPRVRRARVDATGIGAMLAEEARRIAGGRVEPFQFTAQSKADIYGCLRRRFEDGTIRVPAMRDLREDLHAVQRVATSGGRVSYSAPRNADGHSDRAAALALCASAASARGQYVAPFAAGRRIDADDRRAW